MSSYVLDNAHPAAAIRLQILEQLYDPLTRASLDAVGVGPEVWEIGAGGGSIARWAAGKRDAHVTITDVDLRHLTAQARALAVAVIEHDVTEEAPPGTFDLIHARLVLSHLPDWPAVLHRLIGALNPGGWLCVEELDPMLPYQPAAGFDHVINRVGRAFTAALASAGGDPHLGRQLDAALTADGRLDAVTSTGTIVTGHGTGAIAQLMTVNVAQTRPLLIEHGGVTDDDLDTYLAALHDPAQWITMPIFWAARGQAA